MRSKLLAPLGIALVLVLLTAGLASAHERTFRTRLTVDRTPSGAIQSGDRVRIFGELNSKKAACRRGSTIQLIEVGVGQIDTDRTGRRGKYAFRVRVSETTRFRVVFGGKDLNTVHPHNHVCAGDAARIRVRVR